MSALVHKAFTHGLTSRAWHDCQLQALPTIGSVAEQFGDVVQNLCEAYD